MHLKSLTLKGFKSFAQPTTFEFEPGVTAIVGPNGSGKSNVVDALAWVMGEQGAKQLRGGKMDDVIFAGTAKRGPLGRAQVQLTIDNSDGALPIAYSEVQISRTLFRNGQSEYAINGESCRLLDVQELLSDSGLGREMHVIVGQGQLDAVLRATPEERRGFIEEAAGILKHRRRKERTERKLAAMETNLTRLSDLAAEVRRQLKPLGKQAEIAREAQAIQAEVRDAKARLIAGDVARLRLELAELAKSEQATQSERIVLQEQAEQKQLRIKLLESSAASDELDTARRVTVALEGVQGKLRGLLANANSRLAFLATQGEDVSGVASITQQMVDEAAAAASELRAGLAPVEEQWRQRAGAAKQAGAELKELTARIAEQNALISKHELTVQRLTGEVRAQAERQSALVDAVRRAGEQLAAARERAGEAREALAAFVREHGGAGAGAADVAGAAAEDAAGAGASPLAGDDSPARAANQLAALEEQHREAREQLAAAQAARECAREELAAAKQRAAALDAQVSALSRALQQKDASEPLAAAAEQGLLGRVAEHVRVTPGWEAAVSAALGTFQDALFAESPAVAEAAARIARERELGVAQLVFAAAGEEAAAGHHISGASYAPAGALQQLWQRAEQAGLTPVARLISGAPAAVLGLTAASFAAEQLEEAFAALGELAPLGMPVTVVTRAGEVLTPHTLRAGTAAAPGSIELAAELHAAETEQRQAEEETARLHERVERAAGEVASRQQAVDAAYQALRQAEKEAGRMAAERQKYASQLAAAEAEEQRAEAQLAGAEQRASEAAEQLSQAEARLKQQQEVPLPVLDESLHTTLAAEVEEKRAAELAARLTLEQQRERYRAASERASSLAEQFAKEQQTLAEAVRRMRLRDRQAERAAAVAARVPRVLEVCESSLAEARAAQQQAEAERAKTSQELTLLRAEESELRRQLAGITERVHTAELQSYERKLQLSALLERAGAELGLVEEVLLAEYASGGSGGATGAGPGAADEAGTGEQAAGAGGAEASEQSAADPSPSAGQAPNTPADPAPTREELVARLEKAEARLARLGRINPLALEEFNALEQRHKYLSEQLQDLTKTRRDLMRIISELDEQMEGIFAAAFADTQKTFAEVFPVLFPGGAGSISLTDPANMLETGIEMSVRPAGKKVERLSLLSGGERSLAAVAWLVAIFKARPSPFYIMDEVEAALDDANLGRLLAVFKELQQSSQLIVITHQKRTMEVADVLYGVSMRQDGISAVVGQRMHDDAVRTAA